MFMSCCIQAFSISTGHPDWIAVGVEEYGISSSYNGTDGGSRWNVWIGKKDRTPGASFLDRNGLAPNAGRLYVFCANDATTDMATSVLCRPFTLHTCAGLAALSLVLGCSTTLWQALERGSYPTK